MHAIGFLVKDALLQILELEIVYHGGNASTIC